MWFKVVEHKYMYIAKIQFEEEKKYLKQAVRMIFVTP